MLVGFAADIGEQGLARAREKLERKRADLIVFNDVAQDGIGFDAADNEVVLVSRDGERTVAAGTQGSGRRGSDRRGRRAFAVALRG